MPIFDEDVILRNSRPSGTNPDIPEAPEEGEQTSPLEAGRAFFTMDNPIFNATREAFLPKVSNEFDPDFRPIEKLQAERPELLEFIGNFATVKNEEEYNRRVFNAEYELDQREKFSKASTTAQISSALAVSIIDPLILIPAGGVALKAARTGRALSGLAKGAAAGAAAGTIREGVLQATQETRTAEESAINVLAESVLGGLLGGAVGALSDPIKSSAKHLVKKAMVGDEVMLEVTDDFSMQIVKTPRSVGAAEATGREAELEALGLARLNKNVVKTLTGPDALTAPDIRAAVSPSLTIRKMGEIFYNSNFLRKKNLEGEATLENAQNAIFRGEQRTLETLKELESLYLDHTGAGALRSAVSRPEGAISHLEFSDRVWLNMVDETRVDQIDQVNQASKIMRTEMDKLLKELQDLKMLPEDIDPKLARNYMSRVYDLDALSSPAARSRFREKVGNWLRHHHMDGTKRTSILDELEGQEKADKILTKIRGESDQQIALSSIAEGFISKGKFTKKRQLLIPDSEISEFLRKDAMRSFKSYAGRTRKLIETQKALERAGFKNFQEVIAEIKDEAAKAEQAAEAAGKPTAKVNAEFKEQERLANLMYRSMLGQLRKPGAGDRFIEQLLNYQFMRLLGGVTISSLPELLMTPFRQGFLNTLRHGYVPMIRSLETSKMSKDQMNYLIGALESEQSNVLRALSGIDDIDTIGSNKNTFERTMDFMVSGYVKATGIGYWTAMNRRIAAQVAAADIVNTLRRGPKGTDIERLASVGIGKADYDKLLVQINEHTQDLNGSRVLNPHLWKDKEALNKMLNAIQNEVEAAILKPGVEAKPFFVQQYQVAKPIFQFKSFITAATGKIALSSLQRRDKRLLTGLMSIIAAGTMTYILKEKVAGRDVDYDNTANLLLEGVSNSGILGLIGTVVLDTGKTLYNKDSRRWGGSNLQSNVVGPSVSQVEPLVNAVAGLVDGDITDRDKKAAMKMIPFLNIFYIKALTEEVFDDDN